MSLKHFTRETFEKELNGGALMLVDFWAEWCPAVLSVHSLWQKFTGQALEGFTTVIILILFIGSILMICLGIIGYYIAKIYEEVKDRPRYILSDTCGEARHAEKDL